MAQTSASFWQRNGWIKWVGGGLLVAVAVLAAIVSMVLHRAEPFVRARIVEELQVRFHARVELDSFHMSLADGLWAEGKGLRIWPPARRPDLAPGTASQVDGASVPVPDVPMISLADFRFHAPLYYRPGKPFHISLVQLKGLDIHLPPRSYFAQAASGDTSKPKSGSPLVGFEIGNIDCSGANLVLETSKPGKLPLNFAIAHLKLTHVSSNGPMSFEADLTNPRPVGIIHTTGSFGPLPVSNPNESSQGQGPVLGDPGESPVAGNYRFDHADLGGFKGIAGILSSTGHYQGTLRDLVVDGETDTPDFRLTHFGNALPLHTNFHAKVDGTNGDTWLEPVEATLGHSRFTAKGQIVRVIAAEAGEPPHSIGHDIDLAVNVDRGRIEDFLRLASHSDTPLLTGVVAVKTKLHIPPGTPPVHERLILNGSFKLDDARFSNTKIQDRIAQLSMRGQGRLKDSKTTDSTTIESTMQGDFQMAAGVITLPNLKYTVPGAEIDLKGTYGVEGGALNFTGAAKLQATVSQMVGGWKGMLLKPVDRYFKKDGAGTEVPIHIEGTREDPRFGIDFDRLKGSSAEHR
ncbi:MAG: AsmA-like C-terminal region-containing protein [Terracidiphilus sp.]|nr:AsmA-like C-terminal region-containing protein [Terracidiphilus sp.]